MESDQGKLFIGGISWETTEEKLRAYFSTFGEVVEAVIMKDRATGRARGFGFIIFADPSVADMVVLEKHSIDGRLVEAKKAVPKDDQQSVNRNSSGGVASPGPPSLARTKKIFVGGLASTVTENDFKKYFAQFGTITDVVVMYDHGTQRPRGFGFITYDSEDSVDKVLQKIFHELNDKMVEVKRAVPKDLSAGPTRNNGLGLGAGPGNRGNSYAGAYAQPFNSSPTISYAAPPMDIRYGSSPNNRGLYSPYGAVGHGNAKIQTGAHNGAFNAGIYGGSTSFGGASYGSGIHGGSLSGGAYGSLSNSSSYNNAYGSSLGRNPWGSGGASYDDLSSSVGFEAGSRIPSISNYGGMKTWGSSPTHTNSNAGYDNHSYGYEGANKAFLDLNSAGYDGKSSGLGSYPGGLGASRSRTGSGSLSGDIYGSSGLSDSLWRATPADKARSAGFGQPGSGVYGLIRSTSSSGEDFRAVDDGYGASGRQSYRGVPV